jgi:hypothetical protein
MLRHLPRYPRNLVQLLDSGGSELGDITFPLDIVEPTRLDQLQAGDTGQPNESLLSLETGQSWDAHAANAIIN